MKLLLPDVFTVFSNEDYDNDDMGSFWTWASGGDDLLAQKVYAMLKCKSVEIGIHTISQRIKNENFHNSHIQ